MLQFCNINLIFIKIIIDKTISLKGFVDFFVIKQIGKIFSIDFLIKGFIIKLSEIISKEKEGIL